MMKVKVEHQCVRDLFDLRIKSYKVELKMALINGAIKTHSCFFQLTNHDFDFAKKIYQ